MQNYFIYIQYNKDNSVKVFFSKVAEQYIANHLLLKDRYLKYQSRSLVKEEIINIEKIESVVDFMKWIIKAS